MASKNPSQELHSVLMWLCRRAELWSSTCNLPNFGPTSPQAFPGRRWNLIILLNAYEVLITHLLGCSVVQTCSPPYVWLVRGL